MISRDQNLDTALDEQAGSVVPLRLRTRDALAQRRAQLPLDHKFHRKPRGLTTNRSRRRKNQKSILGIHHRRLKKIR